MLSIFIKYLPNPGKLFNLRKWYNICQIDIIPGNTRTKTSSSFLIFTRWSVSCIKSRDASLVCNMKTCPTQHTKALSLSIIAPQMNHVSNVRCTSCREIFSDNNFILMKIISKNHIRWLELGRGNLNLLINAAFCHIPVDQRRANGRNVWTSEPAVRIQLAVIRRVIILNEITTRSQPQPPHQRGIEISS